jgi:hypothetical protein
MSLLVRLFGQTAGKDFAIAFLLPVYDIKINSHHIGVNFQSLTIDFSN